MNHVAVGDTPLSSNVAVAASGEPLINLPERASRTKSLFELVEAAVDGAGAGAAAGPATK